MWLKLSFWKLANSHAAIFTFQVIVYFWDLSASPTLTFPYADVSLSNELGCRLVPCFQALHTPTAFHSRALTQAQTLPECHFKLIKPFSHWPPLSPCISRAHFSLQSLHKLSDEGKTYGGNDNMSRSGELFCTMQKWHYWTCAFKETFVKRRLLNVHEVIRSCF